MTEAKMIELIGKRLCMATKKQRIKIAKVLGIKPGKLDKHSHLGIGMTNRLLQKGMSFWDVTAPIEP